MRLSSGLKGLKQNGNALVRCAGSTSLVDLQLQQIWKLASNTGEAKKKKKYQQHVAGLGRRYRVRWPSKTTKCQQGQKPKERANEKRHHVSEAEQKYPLLSRDILKSDSLLKKETTIGLITAPQKCNGEIQAGNVVQGRHPTSMTSCPDRAPSGNQKRFQRDLCVRPKG
jgi:hypothetical protein